MKVDRREACRGTDSVRHDSRHVHCARLAQPAVVSIIERDDAGAPLRFVLWCSLRGIGHCDERCLG